MIKKKLEYNSKYKNYLRNIIYNYSNLSTNSLPKELFEDIYKDDVLSKIEIRSLIPEEISFYIDANVEQIYRLRRYFHLKYAVRCLVYTVGITTRDKYPDLKTPPPYDPIEIYTSKNIFRVKFVIKNRFPPIIFDDEAYKRLFFIPNPQYANTDKNKIIHKFIDNVETPEMTAKMIYLKWKF